MMKRERDVLTFDRNEVEKGMAKPSSSSSLWKRRETSWSHYCPFHLFSPHVRLGDVPTGYKSPTTKEGLRNTCGGVAVERGCVR